MAAAAVVFAFVLGVVAVRAVVAAKTVYAGA